MFPSDPVGRLNLILAATSPSAEPAGGGGGGFTVDFERLFNNSALIAIIVCLIFGFFWTKPAVDRILRDKEKAEAQRDALISVYEKEIIPTMAKAAASIETVTPVLSEAVDTIARIHRVLERVETTLDRRE